MKIVLNFSLLFVAFLLTISLHAQTSSRLVSGIDVGTAWQSKSFMPSVHYYQMLKVGSGGLLQVGWGGRASHAVLKEQNFTSAPGRLAKSSVTTDTLEMGRFTATSFNFNIGAQLSLMERVDIGANMDLFGVALGSRRTGYYLGSKGFSMVDSLNLHRTYQSVRPTSGALQWVGNNAIGNLNTEIYARIRFTPFIGLKVAYVFATHEARTDKTLVDDNRRFRARNQYLYAGLTFRLAN